MGHKKDDLKRAIEGGRKGKMPIHGGRAVKVAAAATPKKVNPRSAAARDARAKQRGRMPVGTTDGAEWDGKTWAGFIKVYWSNGNVMHQILHSADGRFRLAEELDIAFWEWYAKTADDKQKAGLTFAPEESNRPEPYPKEKQ